MGGFLAQGRFQFDPAPYETTLKAIFEELTTLDRIDELKLRKILCRYPKAKGQLFSKNELVRGLRYFGNEQSWNQDYLLEQLRMKPVRTHSGVAPVTILTRPFPCPGRCIFCPNDIRMPKSYLSMEPGAQRATHNKFDPFAQTWSRLVSFYTNGHSVDKVEIIILGGTWSFYEESYQIWFIKRIFDALNQFKGHVDRFLPDERSIDFKDVPTEVDGRNLDKNYNQIIQDYLKDQQGSIHASWEEATWEQLEEAHNINESSHTRCVGLVVETRPDHISQEEVERIRRLGCTKVQIGLQSLQDSVLSLNKRGHDVAASIRALKLIRAAGFKIHAHWMANLYGFECQRRHRGTLDDCFPILISAQTNLSYILVLL